MNEWFKPKEKKPEQGKKILCMHQGDLYVAQRFGDYWFSVPFYDSQFSRYFEPDLWQDIDFPEGLKGKMKVCVNGGFYDIDSLEKFHPDVYDQLKEGQKNLFDRKDHGMQMDSLQPTND